MSTTTIIRPARILSGAQTGADEGALRAARAIGIPTGGFVPRNCHSEKGPRGWMITQYGLTELPTAAYLPRTIANIHAADATLVFGETTSPGTRKTLHLVKEAGVAVLTNPTVEELQNWLMVLAALGRAAKEGPLRYTVNVAGNRETVNRGIEAAVFWVITRAWGEAPYPPVPMPDPWPRGMQK